jgi:hypothetical protein
MSNRKEDAMRVKSLLTMGFLWMLAANLALSDSDGFAADAQGKQGQKEMAASDSMKKAGSQKRVDVMENVPKKGVQSDSITRGEIERRADAIEEVGSKGDLYPSTGGGTRKDVQEYIRD